MYDYLAKIILLGPSGSGKFVHSSSHQANLELISLQILPTTSDREERMSADFLAVNAFQDLTLYRANLVFSHYRR